MLGHFSSPNFSFSKAQFPHSQPYSDCLLSDPIPWEGLRHGQGLSFQQGLARHFQKPCQDMTVQQGAPKIQPQHHYPRGPFSLWKEPPTVSHQCKPFSCLPSVPQGRCRGIHSTAAPDGSTASPSPCYDGPTEPVCNAYLLGRASGIFLQVELPRHGDLAAWLLSEVSGPFVPFTSTRETSSRSHVLFPVRQTASVMCL